MNDKQIEVITNCINNNPQIIISSYSDFAGYLCGYNSKHNTFILGSHDNKFGWKIRGSSDIILINTYTNYEYFDFDNQTLQYILSLN